MNRAPWVPLMLALALLKAVYVGVLIIMAVALAARVIGGPL
jgi:hypothetical protein